jgi:hypothetical protein
MPARLQEKDPSPRFHTHKVHNTIRCGEGGVIKIWQQTEPSTNHCKSEGNKGHD